VDEPDREVTVVLSGKALTVSSTDGVIYRLSEELLLKEAVADDIRFKIHPAFLADILKTTGRMAYDREKRMVAFRADKFVYLTAVEWTKEAEPAPAEEPKRRRRKPAK